MMGTGSLFGTPRTFFRISTTLSAKPTTYIEVATAWATKKSKPMALGQVQQPLVWMV